MSEFFLKMYAEFEKSGFDASALSNYGEYFCVVVGLDKLKMLLGTEFNSVFGDMLVKIKAMPKVHLIIMDAADSIKKSEYDPWYKAVINPSRGIWIGEGMGTQYLLKSTMTSRQLSLKIDNTFGYFIDGSVTVLMKVITEVGEEDSIETL